MTGVPAKFSPFYANKLTLAGLAALHNAATARVRAAVICRRRTHVSAHSAHNTASRLHYAALARSLPTACFISHSPTPKFLSIRSVPHWVARRCA